MTLGTKLLQLREGKGLTRERMALEINVSKVAYGRWESDLCKPKMDNLIRLCLFYELTFEELLIDVKNPDSLKNLGYNTRSGNHDKDDILLDKCNIDILIRKQNEILRLVQLQHRLLTEWSHTKE